jgi:peptidoglycan hydrolase-like protein with peptidoglycan-binding domain
VSRVAALAALIALAVGAGATPAGGGTSAFGVRAEPARGAAPLGVSLSATGETVAVHWEFGDGSPGADGATVAHTFVEPGAYVVVATATLADGSTAEARVTVTALRVSLRAPPVVGFDRRATFRGRVEPPLARVAVRLLRAGNVLARSRTRRDGSFALTRRIRTPGPHSVVVHGVRSPAAAVAVRPRIVLSAPPSAPLGGTARVRARVVPAGAGRVTVTVSRSGDVVARRTRTGALRFGLAARRLGRYSVRAALQPAAGFLRATRRRWLRVRLPELGPGSRGEAVLALERRLRELGYELPRADRLYAWDTAEAVLAFRKLSGLPWRTSVDAAAWRRLARARTPWPRHGYGDHIEVSKTKQVLLVVRRGRVASIVHVSTGATGNTPVGRWQVYRKVPGWDWVLYYPSYFLRGFAVHGYPSVPAYPASHGCVRVPMWFATRLYGLMPHGSTIWIDH